MTETKAITKKKKAPKSATARKSGELKAVASDDQKQRYEELINQEREIVQLEDRTSDVVLDGPVKVKHCRQVGYDDLSTEEHELRIVDTTGASNLMAGRLLLEQISEVGYKKNGGGKGFSRVNGMLGMIANIKPRDDVEAMLVTQMISVHTLSMKCASTASQTDSSSEGYKESISSTLKLMRTFASQVEALNKYRGKGQQKMTVEHVHVNEGGQAIIGSVEGGAKGGAKK